jgi:hypothetical protein
MNIAVVVNIGGAATGRERRARAGEDFCKTSANLGIGPPREPASTRHGRPGRPLACRRARTPAFPGFPGHSGRAARATL